MTPLPIWYAIYALLRAFAHDFAGKPVWGNINVGLILGPLQFVTTFAITALYIRFASDNSIRPQEVVLEEPRRWCSLDGAAKRPRTK